MLCYKPVINKPKQIIDRYEKNAIMKHVVRLSFGENNVSYSSFYGSTFYSYGK